MNDQDLLLARMAVNFGHASQSQMDEVLAEVESSGKALTELLLEKEICSQAQLQLILSIHGRDMGELVVQEKQEEKMVARAMFCAYCDTEVQVDAYIEGETYQCDTCGAMLQKDKPVRTQRKATITKDMFCPACDEDATIEDYDDSKTYRCPECGAAMVVDEPEGNDDSDEVPMLQEIGINGEVKQTSYEHEVAERKQIERRASLMLVRAREMINIGDYEGAMMDLAAVVEAPLPPADALLLHAQTAIKMGRYEAALESASKLRKQRERVADAYAIAGQAHYLKESYRKAMAELDMCLEDEPQHILALLLRGACQHKLRKLTNVRQDFEKALDSARGKEDKLPADWQQMLRQAAEFVETGKLESFGDMMTPKKEQGSATEIRHKKKAERALKAGEDPYVAAREFRLAGKFEDAKRLYEHLLEAEPEDVGPTLTEAAGKRGFKDVEDYRDLLCNEALAAIAKEGGDTGAAAVHLTRAAFACKRAETSEERGADNALEAAAIWSTAGNLLEADKSFGLAAKLMGWPDLRVRAWVNELPRENQKCKVCVELTNVGVSKATGVRIQVGEYIKPDREMRFGEMGPGDTIRKDFGFKALRRGRDLMSEFKLFFRDQEIDKQLTRVYTFHFDVGAGYDPPKDLTAYWIGDPTEGDAPEAAAQTRAHTPDDAADPDSSGGFTKVVAASPELDTRLEAIETKLDALSAKLEDLFALLGGEGD